MSVMNVVLQIFLGIALLCSGLGSIGLFNGLLYIWWDEGGPKLGPLSHVGVWAANVILLAGIIHASILNGWLGMGAFAGDK